MCPDLFVLQFLSNGIVKLPFPSLSRKEKTSIPDEMPFLVPFHWQFLNVILSDITTSFLCLLIWSFISKVVVRKKNLSSLVLYFKIWSFFVMLDMNIDAKKMCLKLWQILCLHGSPDGPGQYVGSSQLLQSSHC